MKPLDHPDYMTVLGDPLRKARNEQQGGQYIYGKQG